MINVLKAVKKVRKRLVKYKCIRKRKRKGFL